MAKKRSKRRARAPRGPRLWRWTGLVLFAAGVFLAAALLTYRQDGTSGPFAGVWANAGGAAGAWLAGHLQGTLGWPQWRRPPRQRDPHMGGVGISLFWDRFVKVLDECGKVFPTEHKLGGLFPVTRERQRDLGENKESA